MTNQRTEQKSRAATSESSVVYFILACLGALPVLAMLVYQYLSVGGNASYACITGYVPPEVDKSTLEVLLDGRETAFPAGRFCEWESAAGVITTYQTGWLTTIVACTATAVVVWMTILALYQRRPRKTAIALIPAFLVLLSWIGVIV